MNREHVDEWLERGILILVAAALVLAAACFGAVPMQPFRDSFGCNSFGFLAAEGLVLGVGLLWLARCWSKPKVRLLWPPVCWVVAGFAAYAGFRYSTADLEYVARQEVTRVFVYALLFMVVVNNLNGRECSQVISLVLVFAGMCIAGYAIYQFAMGSERVWYLLTPYKGRASGTFINPNSLAGFLEMLLPLGVAFTVTGRLPVLVKVFVGYATLVIAAGIAVSLSRGGWLASGASLVVFAVILLRYPTYRIAGIAMLLLMLAGGSVALKKSALVWERAVRAPIELVGEGNRMQIWTSAARMWQDSPWTGVGPGHFDDRFGAYRTQFVQRQPVWVHNDYLNTLVDWGVAGFVLVLSAWVLLFVGVRKTWAFVRGGVSTLGDRKGDKFAFVLGASCSLVAILVHSIFDFNLHIPANAMLAVTLMALLSGHLRSATERYWVAGRWPLKIVVTLLIAVTMVGLGYWGWRQVNENVWLARSAEQIEVRGPRTSEPWRLERVAALERAFALEPGNFGTAFQLGEAHRVRSEEGNLETFEDQARQAISWYEKVVKLNPYHAYAHAYLALCLDKLDEFDKAEPHIQRAAELDPNGLWTCNLIGLHYLTRADASRAGYAIALPWFERAQRLRLFPNENLPAYQNAPLCERRLVQAARPIELPGPGSLK